MFYLCFLLPAFPLNTIFSCFFFLFLQVTSNKRAVTLTSANSDDERIKYNQIYFSAHIYLSIRSSKHPTWISAWTWMRSSVTAKRFTFEMYTMNRTLIQVRENYDWVLKTFSGRSNLFEGCSAINGLSKRNQRTNIKRDLNRVLKHGMI